VKSAFRAFVTFCKEHFPAPKPCGRIKTFVWVEPTPVGLIVEGGNIRFVANEPVPAVVTNFGPKLLDQFELAYLA
jgi:hypothetical protein